MPASSAATTTLTVLHAGALTALMGKSLGPAFERATGIAVRAVRGHSVALADGIKDGSQVGDLFLSADAAVNETLRGAANGDWVRWFVTFARNAVVLAYSPRGVLGERLARAGDGTPPWYELLRQPGVRMRRNDPDSDPMGYYTVLVCRLAERHYGLSGLAEAILGPPQNPAQVGQPDPGGLASGAIDAMFLYRSAALETGLPFLDLPDAVNLGNPDLAAGYGRATYTTAQGRTFSGRPIRFSAAPLAHAAQPEAARRFLAFLLGQEGQALVAAHHFLPSPVLLGGEGEALPPELRPVITGIYPR